MEAIGGLADVTGQAGGPPTLPGTPVVDPLAGAIAAFAALTALRARDEGPAEGLGQELDLALYSPALYLLGGDITECAQSGAYPTRGVRSKAGRFVFKDVALCADDEWIAYGAVGAPMLARIAAFLREQAALPAGSYVPDMDALDEAMHRWLARVTRAEALRTGLAAGVPVAPVNTIPQLLADPHMRARQDFIAIDDPKEGGVTTVAPPFRLSRTPATPRLLCDDLGSQNESIYADWLGISGSSLDRLRTDGVI